MKNLFYLMSMVVVFAACQKESEPCTKSGQKSISVTVKADEAMTKAISSSESEKEIKNLTLVAYASNGDHIKTLTDNNVASSKKFSFTGIDDAKFPIKIFAIANIDPNIWTSSIPNWNEGGYSNVASLLVSQAGSGTVLTKGTTPLAMYGKVENIAINTNNIVVALTRPMARVSITNSSAMTFGEISFTGLNKSININGITSNPNCTYIERDLTFAPNGKMDFYFMPTSGATKATLTIKNGSITKTATLNHLTSNKVHPVNITNNSIDVSGISISVPQEWEEDNTVTIK